MLAVVVVVEESLDGAGWGCRLPPVPPEGLLPSNTKNKRLPAKIQPDIFPPLQRLFWGRVYPLPREHLGP